MKKIFLFSAIYITFLTVGAYSLDWTSKQFTVEKTDKSDIETVLSLKDAAGNPFTVTYQKDLSDDKAEQIIKLNNQFRNWKGMQIERLSFTVDNNEIQVFVLPSKYEYQGVNIIPHIPAGMLFIYSDLYKFNFSLVKDKYFLKIEGVFISEEKFSDSLIEAINDPVQYLQKTNPLYIINKISQLEEGYLRLKDEHEKLLYAMLVLNTKGFFGGLDHIEEKLIKRTIEIKKENKKLEVKDIVKQLEKEKFKASSKVVSAIIIVYFNDLK